MTIPASVLVVLASHGFFPYIALIFKRVENMEICYIEAGVLERMLARAENLSAHVDRLYERNRRKEPERTGRPGMSACALTSRRVPCRPPRYRTVGVHPPPAQVLLQARGCGEADGHVGIRRKEKAGERKKEERKPLKSGRDGRHYRQGERTCPQVLCPAGQHGEKKWNVLP